MSINTGTLMFPSNSVWMQETKRVRFTSSAGLAINFSADYKPNKKGIYTYADGRTEKRNMSSRISLQPHYISPVLSAGALYELNKKHFTRIEPIVQFNLLKTIDMPVTENLSGMASIWRTFTIVSDKRVVSQFEVRNAQM